MNDKNIEWYLRKIHKFEHMTLFYINYCFCSKEILEKMNFCEEYLKMNKYDECYRCVINLKKEYLKLKGIAEND